MCYHYKNFFNIFIITKEKYQEFQEIIKTNNTEKMNEIYMINFQQHRKFSLKLNMNSNEDTQLYYNENYLKIHNNIYKIHDTGYHHKNENNIGKLNNYYYIHKQ